MMSEPKPIPDTVPVPPEGPAPDVTPDPRPVPQNDIDLPPMDGNGPSDPMPVPPTLPM